MLIEKYGEWNIIGVTGSTVTMQFVNIKNALFSGLMITFLSLSIVCFMVAIILGKIIFPKLSILYNENNQDMVNIATLRTNAEITKQKDKKEEWF